MKRRDCTLSISDGAKEVFLPMTEETEDIVFNDPTETAPDTDESIITDRDIQRYVLQYLLECRGICHEDMLLEILRKLQKYSEDSDSQPYPVDKLIEIVKRINVKLNPLGYKISKMGHGMGKQNVGSSTGNNKFYVYINTVASEESKLATRFTTKEIEFIKWCVEKMCIEKECEIIVDCPIITEVDRIRNEVTWSKCITYSVKSTELLQYKDCSPMEAESSISKLCGLKWFARDENGRVSMDLRCLVELEEYLMANGISTCHGCQRLASLGVRCASCSTSWHIDCYRHQITHVDKYCTCGESLVQNGIYIV